MVWDEEGVRWRREFRTSCCGQWWPLVPALDNSWIRGRSGVVRLYFQHLFSFVFFVCSFFYLLLFLSHRLLLLLFSLFPSFTQSYSFSNQTIVAEWLLVMQSSAGRRVVCSARGGLSRVCYNGTLYPSNEGNPLVFWWIAVTLLWPGRGDFSASGLSTFKKIALTSALDCKWPFSIAMFRLPEGIWWGCWIWFLRCFHWIPWNFMGSHGYPNSGFWCKKWTRHGDLKVLQVATPFGPRLPENNFRGFKKNGSDWYIYIYYYNRLSTLNTSYIYIYNNVH